jgi:hypothetical protein
MAHIVRGDLLAMLAGQWSCILCWFNPMVWLAVLKLRDEAENAADDLVLSRNIPPEVYASKLVGITEECLSAKPAPAFALSIAPIASANRLTPRVHAILDSTLYRKSPGLGIMLAIALPAGAALIAAMSLRLTRATVSAPVAESTLPSGITDYFYDPNPQKVKPKLYNWEVKLSAADSRKGPYEIIQETRTLADHDSRATGRVLIDPEMIVPNAGGIIDFMLYVGSKQPAGDPDAPGNIGQPIKFSGKSGGTGEANVISLPGSEMDRVIPSGKGTQLADGWLELIQFVASNGHGEKFRTDVILSLASRRPQLGAPGTVGKEPSVIQWDSSECMNPLMLPGNYEAIADGNGKYEIRCLTGPGPGTPGHNIIHISFQPSRLLEPAPESVLRRPPLIIGGRQMAWSVYRADSDGAPIIRKELIVPNFLPRQPRGNAADYLCVRIDADSQEMINKLTPVAGDILRDADTE